jgi:hypothetical protein
MERFRVKSREFDAIQWDGTNAETILTNFGSKIAEYHTVEDGAISVTTTGEATFILNLGDWLFADVLGDLNVTSPKAMYKANDYVSG